jgi:ATP adenylyltransferase
LSKSVNPKLNRRVLFRPERYKYVKGSKDKGGCVFCVAASKKVSFKTLCLFQTDHSMVVLNKFPYNSGHLLVLPKNHVGEIFDLTDVEYLDLQLTVRLAAQAIEKVYQPSGFNMGLNHGKAAGAGIPKHLHYHIIPRWEGDLNFFPLIADTKVVIEDLDQSYSKLAQFFKGVS